MKKRVLFFTTLLTMALTMAACGSTDNSSSSSPEVPNGNNSSSTTEQITNEKIENDNPNLSDSSTDSSVDSTSTPEVIPTVKPTEVPAPMLTEEPTEAPAPEPTKEPTEAPTSMPTEEPTEAPIPIPTEEPTATPTPTNTPTPKPTATPTPTNTPTPKPTATPTPEPTKAPVVQETAEINYEVATGLKYLILPNNDCVIEGIGTCTLTEFTIPSEIDGAPVVIIGYDAFNGCTNLNGVVIPEGVIGIKDGAFSGCTNLTTIVIPESVWDIANDAFAGCTSLTNIFVIAESDAEKWFKKNAMYATAQKKEETPSEDIVETPSERIEYDGKTEILVGQFDHIKFPLIDYFNDNSFGSNKLDAFEIENMPSEWGNAWWNAYEDFLVANGSPVGNDGKPLPAFNAIHTGKSMGYQYLYYGYMGDSTDGIGDVNLYPAAMYAGWDTSKIKKEDFADAYFFEIVVDYTTLETRYVNDYRSASLMMLSWICPNPSEVEKVFYDFITDESCQDPISKSAIEKGDFNYWVQVGKVDVCLTYVNLNTGECQFAIREHNPSKSMVAW